MSFFKECIILGLFHLSFCFRSFRTEFNQEIFQRSCPSSHQYWPGIHPHMCAGVSRSCAETKELRQIIVDDVEVLCHPQIQGYILYGNYDTNLLLGWWPFIMIYQYDQNGELIITTESISSLYNINCLIGQKYSEIVKCIYCSGYKYGQNCNNSPTGPEYGQYCKTCDSTKQKCSTCRDGQSPQNDTDFKCALTCQTGHKSCTQNSSGYSFDKCIDGYELLNGQCIVCPVNCQVCSSGVCSECMWPYTLKNSLCLEDRNCMKYDYIYNSGGVPIDTDYQQCDIGYFKKGTRCSSCQDEPGLEKCFICHNANECKSCFGTHYLTANKKCAPYTLECNPQCELMSLL